jgi:threonine dehydratase
VFVGIGTGSAGDNDKLARVFRQHGYATVDLTHDELAAEHVHYMVGGKNALAAGELVYRFEFPERPGALMKFLTSMAPTWNISMFHYRNQGADYSRVLVGLQVPTAERKSFARFLTDLGYRHWDETANPAYRLFLA